VTANVLKTEISASAELLRSEMREMRTEIGQRFENIDQRFENIDQRFVNIDQRFVSLERNLNLTMAQLRVDIGSDTLRAIQSVEESYRTRTSAVDDRYRDLPERVSVLEGAAGIKR